MPRIKNTKYTARSAVRVKALRLAERLAKVQAGPISVIKDLLGIPNYHRAMREQPGISVKQSQKNYRRVGDLNYDEAMDRHALRNKKTFDEYDEQLKRNGIDPVENYDPRVTVSMAKRYIREEKRGRENRRDSQIYYANPHRNGRDERVRPYLRRNLRMAAGDGSTARQRAAQAQYDATWNLHDSSRRKGDPTLKKGYKGPEMIVPSDVADWDRWITNNGGPPLRMLPRQKALSIASEQAQREKARGTSTSIAYRKRPVAPAPAPAPAPAAARRRAPFAARAIVPYEPLVARAMVPYEPVNMEVEDWYAPSRNKRDREAMIDAANSGEVTVTAPAEASGDASGAPDSKRTKFEGNGAYYRGRRTTPEWDVVPKKYAHWKRDYNEPWMGPQTKRAIILYTQKRELGWKVDELYWGDYRWAKLSKQWVPPAERMAVSIEKKRQAALKKLAANRARKNWKPVEDFLSVS
jgi:hypothetical protein